jgi:hypothetical protein
MIECVGLSDRCEERDLFSQAADDFFFILYPFITGERFMDVGMSDAHWVEFGAVANSVFFSFHT